MGTDIHVYVEERQKDGTWRQVALFNSKNEYRAPYNDRNYEMFDRLTSEGDALVPSGLSEEVREVYEKEKNYCYDFREIGLTALSRLNNELKETTWAWVSKHDAKGWYEFGIVPTEYFIQDEEIDGSNGLEYIHWEESPSGVKDFINKIYNYCAVALGYFIDTNIRIIYWFDS